MRAGEDKLVRLAQAGDTDAFSELVIAHQQFVYNLALGALGDPMEAEDTTQEAFVRAWQALPRFQRKATFRTWLYRIATNLCYNRLPRLRKEMTAIGDDKIEDLASKPSGNPQSQMEAAELRAFLHQQIEALPERYRLLIMLRFQHELQYAEIAEIVGIPLGTVKTGIYRARQRLAQALHQFEEQPIWTD